MIARNTDNLIQFTDALNSCGPRPSSLKRAILASFLAVILGGYVASLRIVHRPIPFQQALAVENSEVGAVTVQEAYRWPVRLSNISAEELIIPAVDVSCNCTEVSPRTLAIPPAESRDIVVSLDLTSDDECLDWPFRTPFTVQIIPRVDPLRYSVSPITISGTVEYPFVLERRAIISSLKQPVICGLPPPTFSIGARTHAHDLRLSVECPGSIGRCEIVETGEEKQTHLIRFSPNVPYAPDPITGSIVVHAITAKGESIPPRRVRVALHAVLDVYTVPDRIDFSLLEAGEPADLRIRVCSRSGASFMITSVSTSGSSEIAWEPLTQPMDLASTHEFHLRWLGGVPGHHHFNVRFVVDGLTCSPEGDLIELAGGCTVLGQLKDY
jgi:hypothetical protein